MRNMQALTPTLALLAGCLFLWLAGTRNVAGLQVPPERYPEVVLPSPVHLFVYLGDRFLAANVESIRAAASGVELSSRTGGYRLRAHRAVSQLNPCHEDNYWVGNAALSWGGAYEEGLEVLGRATLCRFWDEVPPFLYGFNQRFFRKDVALARDAILMAASRATTNAAGFRKAAIMVSVNSERDAEVALQMLSAERDAASDPVLKQMLERRVQRLDGLVILRKAKVSFESRFGKKLSGINELIDSGILQTLPSDPLKLGYEIRNGEIELREVKIVGLS